MLEERSYPLFMAQDARTGEAGVNRDKQNLELRRVKKFRTMQRSSSAWISQLSNHPIFKSPEHIGDVLSLETLEGAPSGSTSLSGSKSNAPLTATSSRRSDKICFRGPDVIVAVGSELRIATLALDSQSSGASGQHKVRLRRRVR